MSKEKTELTANGSFSKPIAQLHEFYLSGAITAPEDYIEWFDIIRNAGSNDQIRIYINSGGGVIDTALQFMRVMAETNATITTSIEGSCASAATMIFLSGHIMEVTPNSIFMIHNYSGGTFGKGGEMYDNIVFEREWSKRLLHDVYDGFLTDAEIASVLDNKDIWFHAEDILERAERYMKYHAAKAQQEADDDDEDNSESV